MTARNPLDIAPADRTARLAEEVAEARRTAPEVPEPGPQALGVTGFDLPGSEDGTVTVLVSRDRIDRAAAQALVRIVSPDDGRRYLGVVSAGPFAEPDGLRADAAVLVTVATRGGKYTPPYHGRVQVTLLGEELEDGSVVPPRLRPRPHSPVARLTDEETRVVLRSDGDIRLGVAVGHADVPVRVPSTLKSVLPRHTAILGTTGAGKSTTVANLVVQAQAAGMAVVLLDVEGEYTHLHEPTADRRMVAALRDRALPARALPPGAMTLYHLQGRDTANPAHPTRKEFALQFAGLSPYAVMEILDLSDAQKERYLKAYDICKEVMRGTGIFPQRDSAEQERIALEVDEFDRGYPRMTLSLLIEVVRACLARADRPAGDGRRRAAGAGEPEGEGEGAGVSFRPTHRLLQSDRARSELRTRLHAANPPGHSISWRALLGRLQRLERLGVFFEEGAVGSALSYKALLRPGQVSVIDLSDSSGPELSNLVIADILRGLQHAQDEACQAHERGSGPTPARVLVVIEEAHEFLGVERIEKMPILFEQVARIAKRGRKRWLGLVFVTQLPGHLPRQVFGLVNSYILHKITDPTVVAGLHKTVHGLDEGLWQRLPGLAPGQAVVAFPHMTRPLLAAMDPAGAKLRLVD